MWSKLKAWVPLSAATLRFSQFLLFFCMLSIVNPSDSHKSLLASGSQSLSWLFSCYFSDVLVMGRSFAWWLVTVIKHLKLLREYSAFSSVVQLYPALCDLMDCSTPGFPVHHQLPELAQTHVHPPGSSRWCHPTISSPVIPFSSCLQSFPTSGSFPMSQFFASGGPSIGVSALASVLPINIQDWFPLGWTGWISLQSKGPSRVFSNTRVQKHQFFGPQLFL